MSTQAPSDASVRAEIVVEAPPERAFEVFTVGFASWWPPEHHLLEGELDEMVFEPRAGGAIYDRGVDGSTCRWARVLAYEPPSRVVFSWDIALDWTIETDPERCSEVEVTFAPQGEHRTRVVLEHRHLDRHGDGWQGMRSAVGSYNGWPVGLDRFSDVLGGREPRPQPPSAGA